MAAHVGEKGKTVTLVGATGLIGGHLLALLQDDESIERINVLVRRPVVFVHPKVHVIQVDFSRPDTLTAAIAGSDAVFCAIGTTQKKVKGDKDAYRKVDYDIPVMAGQVCARVGCPQFLLVSSVGANAGSGNFYLQLKGAVEDEIGRLGISSVAVFRPSILLGQRNEFRPGEKIGQIIMKAFTFLIPADYKPITGEAVARAMIKVAKNPKTGVRVLHYNEMVVEG
jgi:uncharacterized protein YbjT (DUF2867 family)